MLKDGYKAIGVDEAELDERRRVERETQLPKRRLSELQFVDEFCARVEVEKDGFAERTLAEIREMEKTPYEHR